MYAYMHSVLGGIIEASTKNMLKKMQLDLFEVGFGKNEQETKWDTNPYKSQ